MESAETEWGGCLDSESDLLEHVQYEAAAKDVTEATRETVRYCLLQELGWENM